MHEHVLGAFGRSQGTGSKVVGGIVVVWLFGLVELRMWVLGRFV